MAYASGKAAVSQAIDQAAQAAADYVPFVLTHPIQVPYTMLWADPAKKSKYTNKHTLRFLTDNAIVIGYHNYIPTTDGKHADFPCTTDLQGDLNRPDWLAANLKDDKNRPLRPTKTTIGIAVERELNEDTGEWEDVCDTFEVREDPEDPTSDKVEKIWPRFWLVKHGMVFWGQINDYWSDPEYGTLTDRNFHITRTGKTGYSIKPAKDGDGATAESLAEEYGIPDVEGFDDPAQGWIVNWLERQGAESRFAANLAGYTGADKPKAAVKPVSRPGNVAGLRKSSPPAEDEPSESPKGSLIDRLQRNKNLAGK